MAQFESLDINFNILNNGVYTLDSELRYVVSKIPKKCSVPN